MYSSVGWSRPRVLPNEAELAKAAEVLNAGSKVAILIGQGAAGAQAEVVEAAEILGAGVAKALLGREVLPDDLPFVTGPIGLLGTMPSDEMVMNCDTFLMIGTSFPYAEWLPDEGSARGVEIDIDGGLIGMRYPMEAHLVGDAKERCSSSSRCCAASRTAPGGRRSRRTFASGTASWRTAPARASAA